MDNKTISPYYLIIFILVIAVIGYFLFYQEEKTTEETAPEIGQPTTPDEECGMLTNVIVDGVFQKIEDGFLYLQPKEKELPGIVELTEETKFSEMTLSETEVIGEKKIESTDLEEGDQISVIAFYDIIKSEKKTALSVRRMVVK